MQENKQFNAVQADLLQLAGLLTEDHWCKGPQAMDARGKEVLPFHATAARWCLYGGIRKVAGSYESLRAEAMWNALNDVRGTWTNTIEFNDHAGTTHRQVQEYIMRAVENAAT